MGTNGEQLQKMKWKMSLWVADIVLSIALGSQKHKKKHFICFVYITCFTVVFSVGTFKMSIELMQLISECV